MSRQKKPPPPARRNRRPWYGDTPSCWGQPLAWGPLRVATMRAFVACELELGDRAAALLP